MAFWEIIGDSDWGKENGFCNMVKGTWKKRGIPAGRIGEVLRTSRTMAEAARTLGVNRSTLHRWLESDPDLMKARDDRRAMTDEASKAGEVLPPGDWERTIAATYNLDSTDRTLLDLARRALEIAHDDDSKASERLAAMGRFQRLVSQLKLEAPQASERDAGRERPPRPERTNDPRDVIRAVK